VALSLQLGLSLVNAYELMLTGKGNTVT